MKYKILLILSIIALASSALLSFAPASEICDPGKGCEVVHQSSYNYTLGIQNSYYGVLIFIFLTTLIYFQIRNPGKEKKHLIHSAILLGSAIAIYFLYLQQFVLNAYCKYCLVVDFSILISLGIIIFNWKE